MGKGMTILCSPQRKHMQIRKADNHMQTSLRGRAKKAERLLYEANNTEDPCAGKPHAGICEGTVG